MSAETRSPAAERERMVAEQLAARGIVDERVLDALRRVPRERFVPAGLERQAHQDRPLAIGYGQTISQPFIVGFMSAALALEGHERVLEVGAGSGYQTAVLAELAREVWALEIVPELCAAARARLAELGYGRVQVHCADGHAGWPAAAPFDAILLAAAPERVPAPLLEQLAPGGRLILPLGAREQTLVLLRRSPAGVERQELLPVRFVPMTGRAG